MDVASWLRSLGLEQYEAVFRENAIDVSVLPDVTDQDLEKLGVLLGHRRKLLRAIANLETNAKATLGPVVAPVAADTSPRDTAERHCDVFRLGRLNGTVGPNGPGGLAGGHFRLPEVRCGDCAALRGLRREVHGRRCSDLLRLPTGNVKFVPFREKIRHLISIFAGQKQRSAAARKSNIFAIEPAILSSKLH